MLRQYNAKRGHHYPAGSVDRRKTLQTGQPGEDIGIRETRDAAQHVVQNLWTQFAGSTSGFDVGGEFTLVGHSLVRVAGMVRPLDRGTQGCRWGRVKRGFVKLFLFIGLRGNPGMRVDGPGWR